MKNRYYSYCILFCMSFWLSSCSNSVQKQHFVDTEFDVHPRENMLVFTAKGSGGSDIFLLNLNTSQVTQVTNSHEAEYDPHFSEDGKLVYFLVDKKLWQCTLDGSGRKQITGVGMGNIHSPVMFFGKNQGIFVRPARKRPYSMGGSVDDQWDLYLMDIDKQTVSPLTSEKLPYSPEPRLSPKGQQLLLTKYNKGTFAIYTYDIVTKRQTKIQENASSPSYSPTGDQICFVSDQKKAFEYEVYTLDTRTNKIQQITSKHGYITHPTFLPDGKTIVYLVNEQSTPVGGMHTFALYAVSCYTGNTHLIAKQTLFDNPSSWKP